MIIFKEKFDRGELLTFSQRPDFQFFNVNQVHGNNIVDIRKEKKSYDEISQIDADGIIASYQDTIAIRTADCLPIFLFSKEGLCAVHAGWRGLHENILLQTSIKELNPYLAYIGPSICSEHFEVTQEFQENFPNQYLVQSDGKLYFDLQQQAFTQLKSLFPKIEIIDCAVCTYSTKEFHSYRRDKTESRNWTLFLPHF